MSEQQGDLDNRVSNIRLKNFTLEMGKNLFDVIIFRKTSLSKPL